MKCLVVDTSTELCVLAVVEDMRVICQKIFTHGNSLSKNLLPAIETLLQETGLSKKNLEMIAVGVGPGSYTGTRVGVAVAKSLAFGLGLSLKTFSSPLAFLPAAEGSFACVLPTRPGPFYVIKGRCSSSGVHQDGAALIAAENLEKYVEGVDFRLSAVIEPNLEYLCCFLSQQTSILPEKAEVLYLHSP